MIITIDGPAGSGKSTAARNLARELDVAFLDTGATYRAATLHALNESVNLEDPAALAEATRQADIRLSSDPEGLRVTLNGCDVTGEIRSQRVTDNAHYLANSPQVRAVLVQLQREVGRRLGDFVTEGRDQGSVVFPDADVKFYISAGAEERARRRLGDYRSAGEDAEYERVLQSIQDRDRRDRSRDVGPLVKPDDAIEIDTSGSNPEQTLAELVRIVKEKTP